MRPRPRRPARSPRELHELAAALASAATPSDVAGALLARVPDLLGLGRRVARPRRGRRARDRRARGGPRARAPAGAAAAALDAGADHEAARTGEAAYAVTREQRSSSAFPDGARLARYAASALAVPLRVEGRVTGAIGFPFNRPHAVDENVLSLARIAAELGGQALQRSLAYERERDARDALERITRLVPRFVDAPEGAVAPAICERGARDVRRGRRAAVEGRRRPARGDLAGAARRADASGSRRRAPRLPRDAALARAAGHDVLPRRPDHGYGRGARARAAGRRPVRAPRADRRRGARRAAARASLGARRAGSDARDCSRSFAASPTTPAS